MRSVERLQELCAEGLYATGAQVAIRGPAGDITEAVGQHSPGRMLSVTHLFSLWCAAKPIVSAAFIGLATSRGIGPRDRIGDLLPDANSITRSCEWRDLLNHSTGHQTPSLVEANLMPVQTAQSAALAATPTGNAAYSDYCANAILCAAIEVLSGAESGPVVDEFLRDLAIEGLTLHPLGTQDQPVLDTIAPYFLGLGSRYVTLYHDAIPHLANTRRDLLGAYGSASGLADLYRWLGAALETENDPLASWIVHRREPRWDMTLRRECEFAAGFMVGLARHSFGALPDEAFGHSGIMGSPVGFYDPSSGVSGGLILNGLATSQQDLDFIRPSLVEAMIADGSE